MNSNNRTTLDRGDLDHAQNLLPRLSSQPFIETMEKKKLIQTTFAITIT